MKSTVMLFIVLLLNTAHMTAKEVTIGMEDFGPYYLPETQSGIIPDIVNAVFRHMPNDEPKFIFGHSNKRLLSNFRTGKVDGATNINAFTQFTGCRTTPLFKYQNVAITKTDKQLTLKKISDLADKSIVSFQGAKSVFGQEFIDTIDADKYFEVTALIQQTAMLYRGRVDVSLGDKLIFLHNLTKFKQLNAKPSDFKFHYLFPVHFTSMGFHDQQLCDRFDQAFKVIQQNGEYDKIYEYYSGTIMAK